MMKSQKFFRLALPLVLTLVLVSSAHAVKVCFDYALFRAAQHQGIGGCDPTPASSPQNPYLDAAVLQTRLSSLGYRRVSDNDAIAFGRNAFNTPGFAERFLKPGDVIFLRTKHVGFVVPGPRIDHYIQVPGASGTPYNANALPGPTPRVVGDRTLTGGFFGADKVKDFLHNRTLEQGGGVEVWRPQVPPNANARQIACPPTTTGAAGGAPSSGIESATLTVSNEKPEKIRTSFATQTGAIYVIEASGVVSDWADKTDGVDAVWCYAEWRCGKQGQVWDQLRINGKGMTELAGKPIPYNPAHVCQIELAGTGYPIEFFMIDAQGSAGDNHGSITVKITRRTDISKVGPKCPKTAF